MGEAPQSKHRAGPPRKQGKWVKRPHRRVPDHLRDIEPVRPRGVSMPKQFQGPEMQAKRVAASHTPEAIAKRKATFDEKARERDRRDHAGFQKRMPNGELWHVWVKQHQDELLDMAANIAVDMERGLIIDPRTEKPWVGGYVKRRIFEFLEVEGLKFDKVTEGGSLPEFMAEPMFSRAVEWARVKRDHSYRVSMQENLPIIKAIYGGATMEIARRIY